MKYLCLVYQEETKLEALSESERDAFEREVHAHREELRRGGHYIASASLESAHTATIVRVRNGRTSIAERSFGEAKERLGGLYLIVARDLNDAIRVASRMPPARTGCVEVRPVLDLDGE